MAWRSSGATNDELVDNLRRYHVIQTPAVEQGFRNVDRKYFVPRENLHIAHADEPLKEGNVHISAPHIYGSVVEALELHPNSGLKFLNIGVGTGYLTCVAAEILGPTSLHFGIEIHEDVVEHCHASILRWTEARGRDRPLAQIHVIHGNGLQVDNSQGEASLGFDRIYVGAAVESRDLSKVAALLRPGGIMVAPVDSDLVKIVRIGNEAPSSELRPPLPRSLRGHPPLLSRDFSYNVISGVRFAPLLSRPSLPVIIPSLIWDPSAHSSYPDSFRKSCKEILLCTHASFVQPEIRKPLVNVACTLPRAIWLEILSYTHRDWFEPPRSQELILRERLREEQAAARHAEDARLQTETRLISLERERDMYREMAVRLQSRLHAVLHGRANHMDMEDEVIVAEFDEIADLFPLVRSLTASARRHEQHDQDDEEEDDDDDDSESEMEEETATSSMEGIARENSNDDMAVSPVHASNMASRQVRTVSISSHDF